LRVTSTSSINLEDPYRSLIAAESQQAASRRKPL
jgi:hypothetical protein